MKSIMIAIILAILLVIGGCTNQPATDKISGTQNLMLNDLDLAQVGLISNGTDCLAEKYETGEFSPLAEYSVCYYKIPSLNETDMVIELKKFTNLQDLNGSYQYDSLHYYSVQGLISENDFGDQSRFRVNNVNDYGGEFNPPGVYYYHLWITKDTYLIHITSSGKNEEAKDYIAKTGRQILSKFG